MAQISSDRL